MKYQLPPLNGLLAFESAARLGNFAKAGEELNLSQATVSHRVRLLERHLGYHLFERLPRGLRLTESGKAYLPSIRKAFEQIFASTSGIFGRRDSGSLTIRAPISYSVLWLSPLIDHFLAIYPGINVRLISSIWADTLSDDDTDIDFRLGYGRWPGYTAEKVFDETVVPVCAPGTERAAGKTVEKVEDLASHSLIHVMGIEDLWMQYFEQAGVSFGDDRRDICVDSAVSAFEIAASSNRIALLQTRFLKPYLDSRRLIVPVEADMQIEQAIYLVTPESGGRNKPEAILFRQWVQGLGAAE